MKDENILLKLNGQVITFIDGVLQESDEKIKVDDILIDVVKQLVILVN